MAKLLLMSSKYSEG